MTPTTYDLIDRYVTIQSRLVALLKDELGAERDWKYLTDVPKSGRLILDSETWQFKKHGTGVEFRSDDDGTVVNAHAFLDEGGDLFDAGRLIEYLFSRRHRTVLVDGTEQFMDFNTMAELLGRLAESGRIHRCSGIGETYRP
jgi:hypothetical protein